MNLTTSAKIHNDLFTIKIDVSKFWDIETYYKTIHLLLCIGVLMVLWAQNNC